MTVCKVGLSGALDKLWLDAGATSDSYQYMSVGIERASLSQNPLS